MNIGSRDLVIELPLHGLQLIEASAGTGKTFTLTAWMLRLILETAVPLPDLLAVTFTRAATAELRDRVRRRLRETERLLGGAGVDGHEARQNAQLIDHALAAGHTAAELRARLQTALSRIDEASIFTIHGFCRRALRDFGFLGGELNDDPVIDQADDLWSQVAADLWRRASHGPDAASYEAMTALWDAPEALARQLPKLCDPMRGLLPVAEESSMAAYLHSLRNAAGAAFAQCLTERQQRTQDNLILQMWQATHCPPFAAAVRRRWPWMLIDEFQDTDPWQWEIFHRIFDAKSDTNACLFLIGDPKQAIYRFRGGDLRTYLRARREVETRSGTAGIRSLDVNYRSRPAVLKAVETLFSAAASPFIDPQIRFQPLRAAGCDDDGVRFGSEPPGPGLILHHLPHDGKARRSNKAEIEKAIAVTVTEIARLLDEGVLCEQGRCRPVRPDDIAVLVRKNQQAEQIRQALVQVGIAAATRSGGSVFASEAAAELRCLLFALLQPNDPRRLRAALATRVLGLNADDLRVLDAAVETQDGWQQRFEQAQGIWRQRGPLPALLPFLMERSVALLEEHGGARLLTDALHLAELLQEEAALRQGPHDLWLWYERHCAAPSPCDAHRLRLDADAQAVQIVTLHKSKGLEYPIVLLPFVAFANRGAIDNPRFMRVHDDRQQPAYYVSKSRTEDKEKHWILRDRRHADWEEAEANAECEEELRLFYVGLTRARHRLHLIWGYCRTEDFNGSPLRWLLHDGRRGGSKKDAVKPADVDARVARLPVESGGAIQCVPVPVDIGMPNPKSRTLVDDPNITPRKIRRKLIVESGQYSFSSLRMRHSDSRSVRGADDENDVAIGGEALESLGGADFGNAVHDVLQCTDFAQWREVSEIPPSQRDVLVYALQRRGLPTTDSAVSQVGELVIAALNAPLPGIGALATLAPTDRVTEMEFHFRLRPVQIQEMLEVLARRGYPRATLHRRQERIQGLMHGYIDLLYRDDSGRFYVVDYKTNRLPAYDPAGLRQAIVENDYDLQYLIYLVAVQRWLRWRIGSDYDASRHLGGAVYLFLRGLSPVQAEDGLYIDRPDCGVIDALDRLFDGETS